MGAKPQGQYVRRVAGDVVLGLGVFAVLLLGLALGQDWWTEAHSNPTLGSLAETAEHLAPSGRLSQMLPGRCPDNLGAMAGLALAFSLLFAFNLGLWGHVRRVCASPRQWRGRR